MKTRLLMITLLSLCFLSAIRAENRLKPRVVILTDIAPGNIEPDDMESKKAPTSYY